MKSIARGLSGLSRLKRDTLSYGIAVILDRAFSFVLLPVLTLALEKEAYGAWSQVLTAHALLSSVLLLGFYHSVMRFVPAKPREEVGRVFHGMIALISVSCCLFLLIAVSAPHMLSQLLFATSVRQTMMVSVATFIISECIFEFVVLAFLRADQRISLCAIYLTVKGAARLAVIAIGASAGAGLEAFLVALSVVNAVIVLVVYLFHVVPTVAITILPLNWQFWGRVVGYSLPIVAMTALGWANGFLNRFVIVHQLGLAELAVFSANYSLASIASVVALIMTSSIVPHINSSWNSGNRTDAKQILEAGLTYYLVGAMPLAVVVGIFYEPLVDLLLPRGYAGSALLVWSLLLFMLLYGVEQMLTLATLLNDSRFGTIVRTVSLTLNIVLCVVLVQVMGIEGAGIAMSVSMALTIGLCARRMNSIVGFRFPWHGAVGMTLPTAGMAGVGYFALLWLGTDLVSAGIAASLSLACLVTLELIRSKSIVRGIVRSIRARERTHPELLVMK